MKDNLPTGLANKLSDYVKRDKVAMKFFRHFATLERPNRERGYDLYRMKRALARKGEIVTNSELRDFGKRLESIGLGTFRDENDSSTHYHFDWDYAPVTVLESLKTVLVWPRINATLDHSAQVLAAGKNTSTVNSGRLSIYCPLRDDIAKLDLPADFSPDDVATLARFLAQVAQTRQRQ